MMRPVLQSGGDFQVVLCVAMRMAYPEDVVCSGEALGRAMSDIVVGRVV